MRIPTDRPVAIDAETWGDGSVRIVGIGWDNEVHIVPPNTQFPHGTHFVGHSINADRRWIGDLPGTWDDTMLVAHLVDENQPMSLKYLAPHYCGVEDWFSEIMPRLTNPKKRDAIPDDELAAYCSGDVRATLLVYRRLEVILSRNPRLRAIYQHVSLPLNDAFFRTAEKTGWPLNEARARALYDQHEEVEMDYSKSKRGRRVGKKVATGRWADEIDVLESRLHDWAGHGDTNWRSNAQVRAVLAGFSIRLPKQTDEGEDSTDMEVLMKVRDQHPIVPVLIKHRHVMQRAKMLNGWLKRVRDGRVYSEYNVAGTVTGRLSGRNPNPQNIPTDKEIRSLVTASSGYVIIAADYKTIELGFAAWQYGESTMLDAYRRGDDLHTLTATGLLGRPPKDAEERKKYGKTPNFGLTFGQGVKGYRDYAAKAGVDLTITEAREHRTAWHVMYPGIRAGWRRLAHTLEKQEYVESISGRRRRFPGLRGWNDFERSRAYRQGCNFVVQSPAGELTHIAAILAANNVPGLILDVHDSLVFEVPEEMASTAVGVIRHIMEHEVPRYYEKHLGHSIDIPVRVDIGAGPSWGELSQALDT